MEACALPRCWAVALRRTPGGPVSGTGKGRRGGGKRNSPKGRGAKGKKGPVGKPSQQTKAKAKKRPNKGKRRGLRSTGALVKRSDLGFEDAAGCSQEGPDPQQVRSNSKGDQEASLRDITPPGTVGQFLLRDFNEACSTCDERNKRNKPSVLQFARQSFVRQKRKLRLERAGQKVKKEKKKRRVRKKPLLTEDEADDEGQGQQEETSSEDPGHRPLGRDHGGFDPGASGSAAAVS